MIIRVDKTKDYTVIANHALNDNRLSLKAKGLWAFIMTKPDTWKVNYRGLQSQLKEGKSAILSSMKELEEAGYLKRGSIRNKDGTYQQGDATLYEKPCAENQSADTQRTKVKTEKVKTEQVQEFSPLLVQLIQIVNPREKPTATRQRELNGRLKEYTEEEIIAAAHAFTKSEWHRDNNQVSIDNVIRASKIGRWHNAAQEDTGIRFA